MGEENDDDAVKSGDTKSGEKARNPKARNAKARNAKSGDAKSGAAASDADSDADSDAMASDVTDSDSDATASDATASDATASEAAVEAATPASPPRPRSAASRARRIGGAAATPRPDADDATTAGARASKPSVDIGKKSTGKSTGRAGAKSTAVSTAKAGKAARSKTGDDADTDKAASGSVTFAVPGWLRWVPGFVFAALAVVFLTLFAVSRIGGEDPPGSTSAPLRQEVLAAAKTCLATLNTYRYDQLTQAETAGAGCTTGKLTSDYKKTVTTVIRKNAPPLKAVQLAKINAAGIESVTKDGKQWTILAYGQLNISTSNTAKQGRVDPFAVVARLEKVKGKWVLSKVDTVSSFSR